jgi:hypothetical protein
MSDSQQGGKRFPLNMRTTEGVRKMLEESARVSGRSLAQEVEFRIERSYARRATIIEALGGIKHQNLVIALINVLSSEWTAGRFEEDLRLRDPTVVDDAILLGAITAILAYADKSLEELESSASKVPDLWSAASLSGALSACRVGMREALARVRRSFPELSRTYEEQRSAAPATIGARGQRRRK